MSMIKLTKENFEEVVYGSEGLVLIDFWAEWCEPCQMLSRELEKIEAEGIDDLKIAVVDVDEDPELSAKFKIFSLPTLILMKNGEICNTIVGYYPHEHILSCLAQ